MKKTVAYFSQTRPEMIAIVPEGINTLLDIGCGAGTFGTALKQARPELRIFGIEFNAEVVNPVPSSFEKVWIGDVNMILPSLPELTYDLIVFNDLLEHLVNPQEVLDKCVRLLRPEGRIMASIPNMRFWPILSDLLFQAEWRYRDAGVMDETHLRFYTRKSIIRMFQEAGFSVERIEGINKTSTLSWRWRILNLLMGGSLKDCLFPQFALLARISNPDK
jgi:2-polyprenyl-3-methyl-5-hydroxy-6-metoxy-1,4-benzoquinol methylase